MSWQSRSVPLLRGIYRQFSSHLHVQRYLPRTFTCVSSECSYLRSNAAKLSPCTGLSHHRLRYISTTYASYVPKSPFESLIGTDRIPRNKEIHLYGLEDEDMGIMTKGKAEKLAMEKSCKIVLVENDDKEFPVYALMSSRRYIDEQKRRRKEPRRVERDEKTLKLNSKITDHDLHIKVTNVRQMLRKGHPVNVTLKNNNPENDVGLVAVFQKIIEASKDDATMKQGKKTSGELTFTLSPIPPPEDDDSHKPGVKPFTMDELKEQQRRNVQE